MKQLILLLTLLCAPLAQAGRVFVVSLDTSSISGQPGFIDFQFNAAGADVEAATAVISLYSGGTLGTAFPLGDVSGDLSTSVTINNTVGFNDLFQAITFGSQIFFQVAISGPVFDSFNPIGTSGSTFAFSLYADDETTPLLTSDPNGYAAAIDIGPLGAVALHNLADSGLGSLAEVPEPATVWLTMTALGIALIGVRRRVR
jgi:hypothetical protein